MTIKFEDGAAYERFMGVWSRIAGQRFLDWLGPKKGLHWLDVGCGNGAFTALVAARCAPSDLDGIDPSEAQLAFAQKRLATARFQLGDAMALPYPDNAFDIAVMPLVIFFVPEPAKGVAEMVRTVRPGGLVTAYAWDMPGDGFPYAKLVNRMREIGLDVPKPPRPEASSLDALRALWTDAGLVDVDVSEIAVQRTFENFDDYWTTIQGAPSAGPLLRAMDDAGREELKTWLRQALPPDEAGKITYAARANAVRGRVA